MRISKQYQQLEEAVYWVVISLEILNNYTCLILPRSSTSFSSVADEQRMRAYIIFKQFSWPHQEVWMGLVHKTLQTPKVGYFYKVCYFLTVLRRVLFWKQLWIKHNNVMPCNIWYNIREIVLPWSNNLTLFKSVYTFLKYFWKPQFWLVFSVKSFRYFLRSLVCSRSYKC